MRTAAAVLGILGGALGLLAGTCGAYLGATNVYLFEQIGTQSSVPGFTSEDASAFFASSLVVLVASVIGIIGGGMATARPRVASVLMLGAAIAGFIAQAALYLLSGPLLLAAALLAFLARKPPPLKQA